MKTQPRRAATAFVVALLALLAAAPAALAQRDDDPPRVTAMSRNLYVGIDLRRPAGPKTPEEFGALVLQLLNEARATKPEERMELVAEELEDVEPDLVGLQEVTTYTFGALRIDYLATLRRELKQRKLPYRVVGRHTTIDVTAATPQGNVRLVVGDAILVKKGVRTSGVRTGSFKSHLLFPTAVGAIPVRRGWSSLKATVDGSRFTFVNTHLEDYGTVERTAQAKELVAGPLRGRGAAILVGDLNSNKNLREPDEEKEAFRVVERAGFRVRQTRRHTCCLDFDVKSGRRDHTIDFVMSRPKLPLLRTGLTGTRKRTSGGHQAADHAGVWATLELEE